MSNFKVATKDDVKNAGFVFVKDVNTQEVKKIATSADFQVGLSNVPRNLIVTGDLTSPATTFNLLNEPTTRTTNIATGAAAQTVTLGSSNSSSALTLDAGSGGINIGTNPGGSSKTINVGTTSAINTDVNIGSEYLASKTIIKAGGPFATLGGLYLSGSTVTTYTIGGETGTGTITLGQSTDTNTISIGNANTASAKTQTINIGAGISSFSGKSLVTVGSTANASALTLQAGTGNLALAGAITTNYTVGSATGTGTISIGQSTDTNTIRIGDYNTADGKTQTIFIGNISGVGTGKSVVTIGSTSAASSLTLLAGTGNIKISTDLISKVGIGNSTPASKLDVATDEAGWAVRILNDGNNVSRFGLFIQNGSDTAAGTSYAVGIHDGDGTNVGYITFSGATVTYGAFTGDHYAKITDLNTEKAYGIIVKIVNTTTIPLGSKRVDYIVAQTTTAKDSAVFGVYSGNFENAPDESMKDYHSIFCLGDGHILVTDDGGNINIGDYICSSNKPGHGMAQDDDILHNIQ